MTHYRHLEIRLMERVNQLLSKLKNPVVIIRLLGLLVFLVAGVIAFLGYINQHSGYFQDSLLVEDFYANVSAELASIAITILVIDAINEWRQNGQLKEQLILQMGSIHNDVADTAVRTLIVHGWLYDGSLRNAYLWRANLANADLGRANLENAHLRDANLECAYLLGANLKDVDLLGANLTGIVGYTSEQLLNAKTLEGATMPDGTKYEEWIKKYWTGAEPSNENEVKALKQHVKEISGRNEIHPNKIYAMLRKEFNVKSYKNIADGQLEKAHIYLDNLASEEVG